MKILHKNNIWLGLVVLIFSQCTATSEKSQNTELPQKDEPLQVLRIPENLNQEKIAFGDKLFHDARLSKDNTLSCASCHALNKGGTDQADVSTGVGGVKGPINSPTVYNSGYNFVQFWDGRAKDLNEQASGPVHNPKEMGSNWNEVIEKLKQDELISAEYAKIYGAEWKGENLAEAIAEFEKSLVTVNSRFDKWLGGDASAITTEELAGYKLFKEKGCTTCHNGANVGGGSFQKLGVMADYFKDRGGEITEVDLGRYNVTKDDLDKHFFKVPSLRVAVFTAPYFHDASRKTLPEAVRAMGKYQLGIDLSDDEVTKIVAFLKTLPGEYKDKISQK